MFKLFSSLKKLFSPSPAVPQDQEQLNASFIKRYRHFRGLLTANNNALQAMAELEKLYYSGESYRMATIRSRTTTILVNVYKMIRHLVEMSNGRHRALEAIFDKIGHDLEEIFERKPLPSEGPFIVPLQQVNIAQRHLVGDKMAHLGDLLHLPSVNVPYGFVVTATATRHFLTADRIAEINRKLQILEPEDHEGFYRTCAGLQNIVLDTPLPADLQDLLQHHYKLLEKQGGAGSLVALRSSALGEDTAGVSFAGLYGTVLDVDGASLLEGYKKIIASKYGPKAIAYRRRRGFRHEDIEMCVGCMLMVDAQVSGVVYTSYPWQKGTSSIRIVATPGIAKGVVDGTTVSALYLLDRQSPHALLHAEKTERAQLSPGQLRQLAETALLLENHFRLPQDIEWSFDRYGKLYILQSRPMLQADNIEEDQEKTEEQSLEPPLLQGGVCASEGMACGQICRMTSPEERGLFPEGAILLIDYPLPEWTPLLNRAAAVIACHGSEAGHLATVAREFSLPALFSLPDAMSVLENGEMVTVDSKACRIYGGRRDDLLKRRKPKRDIMAGSPVQRLLTEALQHITPLNLNDPASHYFKASWCETLHDITRYCHEKSVSEMFSFGEAFRFDKGMAKRLVADIPLEWWVINLADGFRPGIDETQKTIHIDDIVSEPMLAIWQGISAFPWKGPPPISARGFGSIILQSTMRPDIDPAVASRLTVKNYFLISQNFCNLNVRLGYHYAMIESYLSDFLTESYLTFRFKGGAADMRRKTVRTRLLADILREYDFRVELRADTLLARVKKHPRDYIKKRLQVLGYLTLHTRQLDMVLNGPEAAEKYRCKFLREIDEMLAPTEPLFGEVNHG